MVSAARGVKFLNHSKRRMSNDGRIWYHLYDSSTGLPYKGTSATFVRRSSVKIPMFVPMIAHFCKAVKKKNSDNHLKGVSPSDLLVFKNKGSFDKRNLEEEKTKEEPLLASCKVDGLGETEENSLIVVVPIDLTEEQGPQLKKLKLDISELVWFHLYDSHTGNPYSGTSASSVSLPRSAAIDQLKDAVKIKYSDSHLKGVSPSDLKVFKNKDSFDKRNSEEEKTKEDPLKASCKLGSLGESEEDSLIVVVPISPSELYETEKKRLLLLKSKPRLASAFTGSKMTMMGNCGYNGIFPFTFNLPKIVKDAINTRDVDNAAAVAIKTGLLFGLAPLKVPETIKSNVKEYKNVLILAPRFPARTVERITGKALVEYLEDGSSPLLKVICQTPSAEVNATFGHATKESSPDLMCVYSAQNNETLSTIGLAVIELIDTTVSPLEKIGQAFALGSNIIMSHLKLGIPAEECGVPLVLTNGNLYQFGWVTLLKPSLPVLYLTSGILDASIYLDKVSVHLTALKRFCREVAGKINSLLRSTVKSFMQKEMDLCLSINIYHLKERKDIFFRFDDEDKSLYYMWKIYEALKEVPEAVKPLAYSSLEQEKNGYNGCVIYPKLVGYSMGFPLEERLFNSFLAEMKRILDSMHKCNVIHMDLYPSNILWKKENDKIEVRFVDLDAATFNQEPFSARIEDRLRDDSDSQYYYKKTGLAEQKCDYWFFYIISLVKEYDNGSQSEDIDEVNLVYRNLVERCSQEMGGRDKLKAAFESWYEENIIRSSATASR